jgi:hypothetical protein
MNGTHPRKKDTLAPARRSVAGYTLVELVATVSIITLIAVPSSKLLLGIIQYFQRIQVSSQLNLDAHLCLDTIVRFLANGQVSTLQISTAPSPNAPPNSRIDFLVSNGTHYRFVWSSNPMNSVIMKVIAADGVTVLLNRTLATHVTLLEFSSDNSDPSLVHVMIRLDAPWDSSGNPSHVFSLVLPDQLVHMIAQ